MENQLNQLLTTFFPKGSEGSTAGTVYSQNERLLAAASYLYFVSTVILLVSATDSGFVRLHAKHAFLYLILTILAFLLPGNFRWFAVGLVFLLSLVSAVSAFMGRLILIPWVSSLLQNFEI